MIEVKTAYADKEIKLRKLLQENGFFEIRFIKGGVVALTKLLYTTGLVIGLDEYGYERRYCYGNPELAREAVRAMNDIDDEPLPGYVAKRPKEVA